jgi:hypothetical protein
MAISWAYIYEHPNTDPAADRTVVDRGGQRTLLVPVPSAADGPAVARRLIEDDGVTLIELCGGFSFVDAARVVEEVKGEVPVGHVAFAVDSAQGVVDYGEAFEVAVAEEN